MKDYIYIYDEFNNQEKVELVCKFNLPNYEYNYIIYKTLANNEYFITKFKGEKIVNLNNNLNEEEFKLASEILEGITKNA